MRRTQANTLVSTIVAILAVLFGGYTVTQQMPKADQNGPFDESHVQVVEVVDGDTLKAQDMNSQVIKTVRLIGVDTPETKDPRKPVQYYGKEASQYSKDLLLHRNVSLKKDMSDTDKYGRILRYVYLEDGTFVNEKLVREGYARVLTYPPDVSKSELFVEAERDAREHKRGLWQ